MSKVQQMSVITFLSFSLFVGTLVFSRGFLLNRHIIPDKSSPCVQPVINEEGKPVFNHHHNNRPDNLTNQQQEQQPAINNNNNNNNTSQDEMETRTSFNKEDNKHNYYYRNNIDSYLSWCDRRPRFPKMILLLVDALKFDFVKRMPYLSSIIINEKGAGGKEKDTCLYKFMADPPTTTMQRLKALTTGTMPTFIDASANFNSYEIEEDSLIYQFYVAGKRIAFLGDDTWLNLFPSTYFTSGIVEAHPSFNAWDLDTVDLAVNDSLRRILSPKYDKDFDVLVTHVLGVDHCGHRYGPNHPEMERKLRETDEIIKFIHESMSDDTLFVIFGDHGMTNTGDHGGDSIDESEAALVLISKNKETMNPLLHCPKNPDGSTLEISQIDLVPTISILGGIPIPYSSIGQLIPNILPEEDITIEALAANVAQIHQYITHYSGENVISEGGGGEKVQRKNQDLNNKDDENTNTNSLKSSLQPLYNQVEKSFQNYKKFTNNLTSFSEFQKYSQIYFTQVKSIAKSTWTQFDVPMMCTGVIISLLSIICLVTYVCTIPTFEETRVKYSVLSWLWPSLTHWTVMCTCLIHSNSTTGLFAIIISTFTGLLVFLSMIYVKLFRAMKKSSSNKNKIRGGEGGGPGATNQVLLSKKKLTLNCSFQYNKNLFRGCLFQIENSEIMAILLYVFTCLGVFSNSFVINEGYILSSVLLAVVFIHLLCSRSSLVTLGIPMDGNVEDNKYIVKLPVVKKHFKCCWSSFAFLAIFVRVSQVFFRCREELQDCQEEFLLHKQLSSLPADWVVNKFIRYGIELVSLAVFVVIFRHWSMYRKISASKRPSALVAKYIPTVLVVLNCAFRALQGLPFAASSSSKHIRPFFEYLPRMFHLVTSLSIVVILLKPLCCIGRMRPFPFLHSANNCCNDATLEQQQQQQQSTVLHSRNNSTKGNNKSANKDKNESKPNGTTTLVKQSSENGRLGDYNIPNPNVGKPTGIGHNNSFQFNEKEMEKSSSTVPLLGDDNLSEDVFTSILLTLVILITLLMVHITSEGISPSISMIIYTAVCLVGIYRSTPNHNFNSWSAVIAWALASQYYFYATGHQPVFSTIPWDSAFVASSNGSSLGTSPDNIWSWIPPALAVLGNLHVSQILFATMLPLLTYWKGDMAKPESLMGRTERRNAFIVCGKFIALHGLKLLFCMICAGWQRRHLMVWKIFAPKLIFEAVSFIITSGVITFTLIFLTRIDYVFKRYLIQERKREKHIV